MELSHETFAQLIFGCSTRFLNVRPEDMGSPEALVLRDTFFQKSKIPKELTETFFRKTAVPEHVLAEKIRNSSKRPGDDFTIFQGFPLIEIIPGRYACIDPGFLVDKAGRGLYWTLFAQVPDAEKNKLAAFWGAIFETYVNSVLMEGCKAGGRFIPEPKFPNGEQAFDACLLEGSNLVVFEHKSSTLRADCKYGGDVGKLKADLHLKFVEGDDEGAKGLAQLRKSLLRFLKGEAVEGIRSKDVHRIYPSLICLDGTVEVPYVARYFNEQFHENCPFATFSQVVTAVFTLSISDIETLLGYLQRFKLSDTLDSFYAKNSNLLTSMSSSEVPLLKNVEPNRNPIKEGFSDFARRMEEALFSVGDEG